MRWHPASPGRRAFPKGSRPRGTRGLLLGGVRLRGLTWLRASSLDTRLADGTDPTESVALSLRASQLSSGKTRAHLASALEGVVELAERQPRPPSWPPLLIRRAEVQACRSLLLDLVDGLHEERVSLRGLAMTSKLLREASSPLYFGQAPCSLREAVVAASAALLPYRAER